ncbi:LLM class F420-dependent oxidoreductase [Phytomonospora sp. NPDC050363]|uniref:LLM class F420-dependent oxidoreductase n=1 Tax=Phytomonospora sp. NPDC050363 TaxID=3155642 RepID=UPI0033C90501
MRLGVNGLAAKATLGPAATVRLARLAEELGYASWWVGDHVVLPSPRTPESPMEATDPILDPLVHLAYVAAVTTRIELATGIVILPQRNPVVLAKQAASLDVLSGGRLLLGVGAGYLEPEMTAVGVAMSERGGRTDEYIDAMTSLWTHDAPAFEGRYASFRDVDAHPRPARPGGPRVVIGGHSRAALRRAVGRGHGWFGMGDLAELERLLAGLREAAGEVERPDRLGRLEVTYLHFGAAALDRSVAERYESMGVDRLLVYPLPLEDVDDVAAFMERYAGLLQ